MDAVFSTGNLAREGFSVVVTVDALAFNTSIRDFSSPARRKSSMCTAASFCFSSSLIWYKYVGCEGGNGY
jgi:hypothetical protein